MIDVTGRDRGLEVVWSDEERPDEAATFTFPWRWLRDHGEDEGSFNPESLQRITDTFAIPADICAEYLKPDERGISVEWTDGSTTEHRWQTLLDLGADQRPTAHRLKSPLIPQGNDRRLWSSTPDDLIAAPFEKIIADDAVFAEWLFTVHELGYGIVERGPEGHEGIQAVADRIGYVRNTVFGGIWDLAADVTDHADSAYDTTYLAPHTDGTYSHDAPGLQLFCCQERKGTGGESILVDGFAAAAELSDEHASVLASIPVAGRYVEPGVHLAAERPALRVDPWGVLAQVSLNNYDRAPVLLADEDTEDFYEAYDAFHSLVTDPARRVTLGWEPGRLLLIDNWRVLHGRSAFTGARRFLGCYMNHEDFESRLRVISDAALNA